MPVEPQNMDAPVTGQEDSVPQPVPEVPQVPEAADETLVTDAPLPRSRSIVRRVLALGTLVVCVGATLAILAEGRSSSSGAASKGLKEAVRPAWEATGQLSETLNALKRGQTRAAAIRAARAADDAVAASRKELRGLTVPTSEGDVYAVVDGALRAQAAWVSAVGSTLLNPASPRRADLSRLAKTAMARSAAAERFGVADGPAVRGTGKLLSATASKRV